MIELLNIDCMEYMKTVPDKHFDIAIVDPPYGLNIAKNGNIGYGDQFDTRCGKKVKINSKRRVWVKKDWDKAIPNDEYFTELVRVSKNQIIWGENYFNIKKGAGRIIWDKVCDNRVSDSLEIAYCSSSKGIRIFRFLWNGIFQGKSMKEGYIPQPIKSLYEERIHPTQKPKALYAWILENYAKKGDLILDTHLGSGSIAIVCDAFGFDLVACEIDKDYYDAAIKRFNTETALPLFDGLHQSPINELKCGKGQKIA